MADELSRPAPDDVTGRKRKAGSADRREPEIVRTVDYEGPDRRVRAKGSVGRRHADRKGPRHRRDIWLFVVTVLVFLALSNGRDSARESSRTAVQAAMTAQATARASAQTAMLVLRVERDERATARNQKANTASLCSLRENVRRRVVGTAQFLKDHPGGIPGIPAGALRVSLANERETLKALAGLACRSKRKPPPALPPILPPRLVRP